MPDLATACWTSFDGNKDISALQDLDQDQDPAVLSEHARLGLAKLMGDQHAWLFDAGRVILDFGIIGAYAGGPSGCTLSHDDLAKALKPGKTLPSH